VAAPPSDPGQRGLPCGAMFRKPAKKVVAGLPPPPAPYKPPRGTYPVFHGHHSAAAIPSNLPSSPQSPPCFSATRKGLFVPPRQGAPPRQSSPYWAPTGARCFLFDEISDMPPESCRVKLLRAPLQERKLPSVRCSGGHGSLSAWNALAGLRASTQPPSKPFLRAMMKAGRFREYPVHKSIV